MSQFVNTIKSLISANRTKLALEILMDYLKDRDTDLYNQCLMHQSAVLHAEKEYSMGIINRSEASQVLSKVRYAVINMTDELSKNIVDDKAANERAEQIKQSFKETEFDVKNSKSSPSWQVWTAAICLAVVIVFLAFKFLNQNNENPAATDKKSEIRVDTAVLLVSLKKDIDQYFDQKDYEKSLIAVNKAIQLRPDFADYYNTRASIYFYTDKIDLAYSDAQRSALLNPDNCWVYATLAQIATKQHDTEGFYRNIELSLRKRCEIWNYDDQPGIVEHVTEKRFQNLLDSYKK